MTAVAPRLLDDVNVVVSGQGGDGSLTVSTLLGELLRQRGLSIYTERDVLSRIKGGKAAAGLRASTREHLAMEERLQLAVVFDDEGAQSVFDRCGDGSVLVYDDSDGPLAAGAVTDGVRVFNAPFGRLAVRRLGRILYKNSIAIGVVSRVLGMPDEELANSFRERFARLGPAIVASNIEALEIGFELADEMGLATGSSIFEVAQGDIGERLLITGNEALGFGFVVAGGRFFSGYPITPATDILEYLQRVLPQFGGIAWQAEDELAAVNMAIGASLAGVRAMTGTSSPGISLMQEGIGQAGSAEIPLVIVNAQRAGPSTGLPTKPEQSDMNMMVFGGNGDFPRIVLAPGHPEDCFHLAIAACNLAQRYQCPVYIAMDQPTSQNTAAVEPFDLESVEIDQGKRLDEDDLKRLPIFQRYAITEDGVSPYTVPGTPGGASLVTGNERNEFGIVSTDPANRVRMVDKRQRKIELATDLPQARRYGDPGATIGFIGVGAAYGVCLDLVDLLAVEGVETQLLQPRTLWPVQQETLDFIAQRDRTYVVEHNATGQLEGILVHEGADRGRLRRVLRYDGTPLRASDIAAEVLERERA